MSPTCAAARPCLPAARFPEDTVRIWGLARFSAHSAERFDCRVSPDYRPRTHGVSASHVDGPLRTLRLRSRALAHPCPSTSLLSILRPSVEPPAGPARPHGRQHWLPSLLWTVLAPSAASPESLDHKRHHPRARVVRWSFPTSVGHRRWSYLAPDYQCQIRALLPEPRTTPQRCCCHRPFLRQRTTNFRRNPSQLFPPSLFHLETSACVD
ncbi:formin-like protein 5 [Iris pallida]|uniref:Formin-like protein 5 n=1 Tax=Iris pallida TaxID=29817 RepID=A0AAX6HWE7_IRIPA|nr:formin-like protein 5 [Iris pallida]